MKKLLLFTALSAIFAANLFAQNQPPAAEIRNVTGEYFGTKIVDSYRWMENEKDPEFTGFLKGQADFAQRRL